MHKVALWHKNADHLENYLYCLIQFLICIVLYIFLFAILYSFFVLEANVNHVIPCLSIMWKSSGSFFIMHITLVLFLYLIVTILGKLIYYYLLLFIYYY